MTSKAKMLGAAACVAIVAAACSSSSKSSTTSSSSGPSSSSSSASSPASLSSASGSPSASHTVTVGLISDITSLGTSGNKTSVEGMAAAVVLAERDGWTLKYIVADDATNPATALAAAQKLVDQDHVTAIIAVSSCCRAAPTS